jgi:imidazolonepropionase-like amidohydrolase
MIITMEWTKSQPPLEVEVVADTDGLAIAFVGATVIDGNGGDPLPTSTVLIQGTSIAAVGRDDAVHILDETHIIDATGKFLLPGFIDTNVHLAPFAFSEELVRYRERFSDIALETAQLMLRHGITTVHDSYGALKPLLATRDAIARGDAIGPRLYVAGNILGYGGPGSATFGSPGTFAFDWDLWGVAPTGLSFFLEQIQDEFTEGAGEELIDMEPDELRQTINAYLDKGVDFVKYGGTTHIHWPALILFSPEAQAVIVEETHRRGKFVETHSTSPEGIRISLEAGIDLVQHPELLDVPMSDRVAELHVSNKVICSMHTGFYSGNGWKIYQGKQEAEREKPSRELRRPHTGMERRREFMKRKHGWWRSNAQKLLRYGCTMTAASDAVSLQAPELTRESEALPSMWLPGSSTLEAIEGLVEIGMSPMQTLVAATRNGALAARALDEYGTIEVGKAADLLLLDADPLADIHNIWKQSLVMAGGRIVDTADLPTAPVLCRADGGEPPERGSRSSK